MSDWLNKHRGSTACLLLILFLLNHCTTSTSGKKAVTQHRAANTAKVIVKMNDMLKFEPPKIIIKAGQTVEWLNASVLVHTVTADPKLAADQSHVQLPENAAPFNSGNIAPEGVYKHTFNTPGQYRYFCIPHEATNMVGAVLVEK